MKTVKYIFPLFALFLVIGCSSQKKVPLHTEMSQILNEQGVDEAVRFLEENYNSGKYSYDPLEIDKLGKDLFNAGNDEAIKLFESNHKLSPDVVETYISLSQAYQNEGDREKSAALLEEALKVDSLDIGLVLARKHRFFVADDFNVPTLLEKKPFKIRPITAADAEMDYDAIKKSLNHLKGVLGRSDWPDKYMTLEQDLQALAIYAKEFKLREGFVYAIMNEDESKELGCLYIYPARVDRFDAEVVFWLREDYYTVDNELKLYNLLESWFKDKWEFKNIVYPGRNISWTAYLDELANQNQKYH